MRRMTECRSLPHDRHRGPGNALQVKCVFSQFERLLEIPFREQTVVETEGEHDRCLVADRLLHSDHKVDVLDDGIRLGLRVASVQDYALHELVT